MTKPKPKTRYVVEVSVETDVKVTKKAVREAITHELAEILLVRIGAAYRADQYGYTSGTVRIRAIDLD